MSYLVHLLPGNGIRMNSQEIRATRDFPILQNAEQVKSFRGFASYYRQNIKDFERLSWKNIEFEFNKH